MKFETLGFLLFYSDGLHLVKRGNLQLEKVIESTIIGPGIPNYYKNAPCFTDDNLNQKDFSTFSCIVPFRNSFCHIYKARLIKSSFKAVSISSVHPGTRISNINVQPSKPISSVHSIHTGKSISNSNTHPNKLVTASYVSPGKPILATMFV